MKLKYVRMRKRSRWRRNWAVSFPYLNIDGLGIRQPYTVHVRSDCAITALRIVIVASLDAATYATTAGSQSVQIMAIVTVILLVFFQSLLLVLPSAADPTGTKCAPAPRRGETCVCQTSDGIIDMAPLSNGNETARCVPK